jgi:hypothetical protein
VDPIADTLTISVGNKSYVVPPSALTRVGKKARYVFKDKPERISGFVDLFKKGSRGLFKVADKGFFGTDVGSIAALNVGFEWGGMDYTVGLVPTVSGDGQSATFASKRAPYATSELFVTAANVSLNDKKEGKDKPFLKSGTNNSQTGK